MSDLEIRRIISCAINRTELLQELEEGEGVIADGPFHPESWAYHSGKTKEECNPKQAREFLKEKGLKIELSLAINEKNEHLIRVAKLVRQQLQEVGIGVKFFLISNYGELFDRIYGKGDFRIYLFTYNTSPQPEVAGEQWHSEARPTYNIGHYHNKRVDQLLDLAKKEKDRVRRVELYAQVQTLIKADQPAVFLYYPYTFFAASKYFFIPEKLFSPVIPYYLIKDVFVLNKNESKGGD